MRHLLWSVVLVSGLAACGSRGGAERAPVVVKVETVALAAAAEGPRFTGSVVPSRRVDLAFRYGGYVDELWRVNGRTVQEGDRVPEGAVLARVRQSDYVAKVTQAGSQLAAARATLEQARNGLRAAKAGRDKAEADFTRATSLYKTQSLTRSDLDAATAANEAAQATAAGAEAQVAAAQAQVDGARAVLDEAELALGDTAVRAPMDGIVVRRLVELGSLVGPGTPAFVLADARGLSVMFAVPDTQLAAVPPGTELTLRTEVLGAATVRGRVVRVSPAADPRSRAFDVEIALPAADPRLKLGMIASVVLPGAKTPMPVVPLTAVVPGTVPDRFAVFVISRKENADVAERREVQLGGAVGNAVAVTAGVSPGDRVVVTGATLVRPGEPVRIVP